MNKFRFKQFEVSHEASAMKVGTDGVTLGAWARCRGAVLDAGSGCGLIGLMAAQRGADSVTMVEIDPAASAEGASNAAASPWADKVTAVCGDFLRLEGVKFDCIISNPPFFATGELAPDAVRAQARHEGALTPDAFMHHASRLLNPGATVSIIVPADRASRWIEAAAFNALSLSRRADLFTRRRAVEPRRVLLEFANSAAEPEVMSLHVQSAEYQELVKDFYL